MQGSIKQQNSSRGHIYLLMGYLGSGKTTFIRSLLQNTQNKKYAIIQNQFSSGQMGIEQPLIVDQSGVPFSSFLQLPNGCICCSAKNDLIASIEYILANTQVRQIVVQTNGLADPAESIKQFWFDQQMKINAYLHSVIGIFSVQKFNKLKNQELFEKQIVYANKALLTFIDKSTIEQAQQLQQYIKQRNKQCSIQRNTQFKIVEFLSGHSLFDLSTLNEISENKADEKQHNCKQENCEHKHQHKNHHEHIVSIFVRGTSPSVSSKSQVESSIGQLLWESEIKVLRIKGVYSIQSEDNVLEIQGVDDVFQVKQTKTKKIAYAGESKVLVIVKNEQKREQSQIQEQIKQMLKIQSGTNKLE